MFFIFLLSCFQTVFLIIAHQDRLIVTIDHLYYWLVEFVLMSCCGNAHGPVNETRLTLNDDTKGFTTTGHSHDLVKRDNTTSLIIKNSDEWNEIIALCENKIFLKGWMSEVTLFLSFTSRLRGRFWCSTPRLGQRAAATPNRKITNVLSGFYR